MKKKAKKLVKLPSVHETKKKRSNVNINAACATTKVTGEALNDLKFCKIELLKEKRTHQMARNLLIDKEKIILRLQEQAGILINEQEQTKLIFKEYESRFKEWERDRSILIQNEQKAISKLESCKQTMSFRLGHAIIFGFKSFNGFKQMFQTILSLYRERKSKKHYGQSLQSPFTLQKPKLKKNNYISAKPVLQWQQEAGGQEYQATFKKYPFKNDILTSSELVLDKEGCAQLVDCQGLSQLVVNINAYVKNGDYDEKQALLTIDFIDSAGERLDSITDLPFSKAKNQYYFYLNVDPQVEDQLLLVLPLGTEKVGIGVATWDAKAPVYIANEFGISGQEDGISVILPTYKGQNTILTCLNSIVKQTLSYSAFEVLVIINGEKDDTPLIIEKIQKKNPKINIKMFILDEAGVSNARNYAIQAASRSFVTFVDDDDYIAPEYLESLYSQALYNSLVLTGIEDVKQGVVMKSPVQDQLLRAVKKENISYFDVTSTLTMNACKLAPSHMVKSVMYDSNLRSGEDVVFWIEILRRFVPKIAVVDAVEQANYKRVLSDNSISRQQESYDFNVRQRLDVIKALIINMTKTPHPDLANFIQSKIHAQSGFIQRYLKNNQLDYEQFILDVEELGIENEFVSAINSQFSKTLIISYCYAPYVDTSGIVMSKRIAAMKQPVDIISNNMDKVRSVDGDLNKIASSYIGKQVVLNAPQAFSNWQAIEKFSELAILEVGRILSKRQIYESLYSRAMWPASHFAAAVLKKKYPQMRWVAEFSDPLLLDVTGKQRFEALNISWLEQHDLIDSKHDEGNTNLFYWCEVLAYLLADEIIFTNENQRDYMLSYINDYSLQQSVLRKSSIVPQPTLTRQFYDLSSLTLDKESNRIELAYFGSFYVNRGFKPLFDAWVGLPEELKQTFKLTIYTQQNSESILSDVPEDLRVSVCVKPYVGYFDFLKLSDQYDGLIVVDCLTRGLKISNPYLPSKISDYLGSKSNVIVLFEAGSPMSKMIGKRILKADIYDKREIRNILKQLFDRLK